MQFQRMTQAEWPRLTPTFLMPCSSISMSCNITNPHTDNTVSLSMSLLYYCLSWLRSVPIGQFHDDSWDLLPQNCTVACWEKAYPVPTHEERGLRVSTRVRGTYEASSYCLLCWYHNLYVLVLLTLIYLQSLFSSIYSTVFYSHVRFFVLLWAIWDHYCHYAITCHVFLEKATTKWIAISAAICFLIHLERN